MQNVIIGSVIQVVDIDGNKVAKAVIKIDDYGFVKANTIRE